MDISVQGGLVRLTNVMVWNTSTGTYISAPAGTTASVTITDSRGIAVANAANMAMNADGISGNFSLQIPNNVVLTAGALYTVTATATYGGVDVPFQNRFRAQYPPGNSTPA